MSSDEDKKTKTIMSTRGHIYLKLKDENKGQVVKFKITKLAGSYHKNKKYLNNPIPDLEIPKTAEYLRVFNHFDSYVAGGIGEDLLKNYDTYDKVLNLLAMGDLDAVDTHDGTKSIYGCYGLVSTPRFIFDDTKIKRAYRGIDGHLGYHMVSFLHNGELPSENALCESYAYYFDGNTWYVTYDYWDKANKKQTHSGWLKLEDVVAKIKAGKMPNWV